MELSRIPANWWQIYKQTSSNFYASKDVSKRVEQKILLGRRGKAAKWCLITFKQIQKRWLLWYSIKSCFFQNLQYLQDKQETPVLESLFNSEYCETFKSTLFEEHWWTTASANVYKKLRNIQIFRRPTSNFSEQGRFCEIRALWFLQKHKR